ncbi:MAG: hypothetical protein QXP42_05175 [Candidatus Micrarchaeia archaeon]
MKKKCPRRLFYGIILILLLSVLGAYTLPMEERTATIVTNALAIATAATAVFGVSCFYRLFWKGKSEFGFSWLLVLIGVILWLCAEATWAYYDVLVGVDVPYPSLADVAWTLGYLPIIAGLYRISQDTLAYHNRNHIFAVLVLGAVVGILLAIFLVPPISNAEVSAAEKFFDVFYIAADIIIVTLVVLTALFFFGSKLLQPWLVMLLGFLLICIADIWFVYLNVFGGYGTQHPVDALYSISYLLIGFGAFFYREMAGR